jgi:hypothetical protein
VLTHLPAVFGNSLGLGTPPELETFVDRGRFRNQVFGDEARPRGTPGTGPFIQRLIGLAWNGCRRELSRPETRAWFDKFQCRRVSLLVSADDSALEVSLRLKVRQENCLLWSHTGINGQERTPSLATIELRQAEIVRLGGNRSDGCYLYRMEHLCTPDPCAKPYA